MSDSTLHIGTLASNNVNNIVNDTSKYDKYKEKGWLSGIMQNEAMMSPEERMIYETFGGRDTII